MILQSSSQYRTGAPIRATYTTQEKFLECLGWCDRRYTSEDINSADGGQKDVAMPPMLRATAESPYTAFTCTKIYSDNTTNTMLNHASAVIPASNGAFWCVYPFHWDTLAEPDDNKRKGFSKHARLAVRYYPAGARPDDYYTGELEGNYYAEAVYGAANEATIIGGGSADKDIYAVGGHPCGATYLNITLPITIPSKTYKAIKSIEPYAGRNAEDVLNELKSYFGQDGVHIGDSGVPCVDVLVCYGGHHWVWVGTGTDKKLSWMPDGTIRFYVPSPRINIPKPTESTDIVTALSDPRRIVWQTIAYGNSKPQNWWVGTLPYVWAGASLIKLEGNKFMSVGGLRFTRNTTTHALTLQHPDRGYSCYPWAEYHVSAVVVATELTAGGASEELSNTLHIEVQIDNYVNYTGNRGAVITNWYPCFNPWSKEAQEAGEGLHENTAPLMYPILYNIDGHMIAHGAEWIGRKTPESNIVTLRSLLYGYYRYQTAKTAKVCHIPLISSQYILRKSSSKLHVPYPLNVSGALGLMEGAISLPAANGKSLIVLGGITSKYGEHCYAVREGLKESSEKYKNLPEVKEIVYCAEEVYAPTDDHLFSWDSKIITPSVVSFNQPFTVGIDTLINDCLFSQCVQLANSDYFVAPSSYFQYYDDGKYRPNMTLLKRRTPVELSDAMLNDAGALEAYYAVNSQVSVSEIINLQVWMEKPATYAAETPCCYGRASTAKNSLGAVLEAGKQPKGYWLYRLGNGSEPAEYYHIITQDYVLNVWPSEERKNADRINTAGYTPKEEKTPGYPDKEWV